MKRIAIATAVMDFKDPDKAMAKLLKNSPPVPKKWRSRKQKRTRSNTDVLRLVIAERRAS
jgi:hypothetical protein